MKAALAGTFLFLSRPALAGEVLGGNSPEGRLLLYNTHTGESLDVTYRDRYGAYDENALSSIDHFMRCHYTQEKTNIDVRVIEYLNAVDRSLGGGNTIHVVSGYRSPEYNKHLLRQGRRVARNSLHLLGKAVDIRIPGISLSKIRKAALNMRYGGVGWYPRAGFVHLDSGSFRFW